MKPDIEWTELLSGGNIRILRQTFCCPLCGYVLDAVPDDLPECCDSCGEPLDFTDVVFIEDKIIGVEDDWRI